VRGTLEVPLVMDGVPCVIFYKRLCGNSNRSLSGTLAEAVWYFKSVRAW
jgi:hypothetical protein